MTGLARSGRHLVFGDCLRIQGSYRLQLTRERDFHSTGILHTQIAVSLS